MSFEDYIKPLKLEYTASDIDFMPTEADPSEDGILTAGIAIESSAIKIEKIVGSHLAFKDPVVGQHTLSELLSGSTTIDLSASSIYFNNLTNGFSSINVQDAIEEAAGQGGTTGDIWASDVFFNNSSNSFLASNVQDVLEEVNDHINDNTIHFAESSINHSNIQNIGINSHSFIDAHIDDNTIHFTIENIIHSSIQGVGINSHSSIDAHIDDDTIHFTEDSINHSNIQNIGVNSHSVIDDHIIDFNNPHNINVSKLTDVNVSGISDKYLLQYNLSSEEWKVIDGEDVETISKVRFTIPLIHNGTLTNGDWIGYDSLVPGDDSPIIIGKKSELQELTFTNNKSNASYTLEIYKNGMTAGDLQYTISKTNTQYFVETDIGTSFNQGDRIFIKYVDNGINASDTAIMLFFKVIT